MSEERFAYISVKLDQLELGQEALRTDIHGLREGQTQLGQAQTKADARLSRLEVIQEMTLDSVKQIAESHASMLVMMQRGFADLRTYIDQRIAPIEATLREHSAILKKHDLTR